MKKQQKNAKSPGKSIPVSFEGRFANTLFSILVLASGTAKEGPGPLVSMFGTAVQAIPVTIVPGNFTNDQIDALA